VVVFIHSGGYEYLPYLPVCQLTIPCKDMTEDVLLYIINRTWLPIQKTELLLFLSSIALVSLVMFIHRSSSMVIESIEGFLAGPTMKNRGALNAGLRMYSYRFSE
jgi:hypothetical protein